MSRTTAQDISENEIERRWAQYLTDADQPEPLWLEDLRGQVRDEYGDASLVDVSLSIICQFPPNANNDQVSAVVEQRAAEECLFPQNVLESWLFADQDRLHYLDEAISSSDAPGSLLEALRSAWDSYLRDAIATVRVFLCSVEDETP